MGQATNAVIRNVGGYEHQEELYWQGQDRPHVSGYIVGRNLATETNFHPAHGVTVHSWHRTQAGAQRELRRATQQGNGQHVYQLVTA